MCVVAVHAVGRVYCTSCARSRVYVVLVAVVCVQQVCAPYLQQLGCGPPVVHVLVQTLTQEVLKLGRPGRAQTTRSAISMTLLHQTMIAAVMRLPWFQTSHLADES